MARRDFARMREAAAALSDFEKERRKKVTAAVRVTAKAIAKEARARAKALKVVKKATRHNKNIKVVVAFGARYSTSQNRVIGFVRSTGLVAKIEMGLRARRFRLPRKGTKPRAVQGPQGWINIGNVIAGGQTFKKKTIVEMTATQASSMSALIDASMQEAAQEVIG